MNMPFSYTPAQLVFAGLRALMGASVKNAIQMALTGVRWSGSGRLTYKTRERVTWDAWRVERLSLLRCKNQ
jgi:hypothetical protein